MAILGLGYFGIGASNIGAWRTFMASVLGAHVEDGPDGSLSVRVDTRAWRISIEPDPVDDLLYAGWEVAGASALDAMIERIAAAGVAIERDAALAANRGVMELARFVDPAGVASEIFWGATERTEVPIVSPTGVSGFVTGEQGLGHLVVATPDPAALEAFYIDVLGFSLSDRIDFEVAPGIVIPVMFAHCNPRHHSFAFAPMAPGNPKKLIHFMLQTRDFNDVGFALDRVHAHSIDLSMTLGRHVNDQMVSFYAWTPSGFEVEYGWGAVDIDPVSWTFARHDKISMWGHHRVPRSAAQ